MRCAIRTKTTVVGSTAVVSLTAQVRKHSCTYGRDPYSCTAVLVDYSTSSTGPEDPDQQQRPKGTLYGTAVPLSLVSRARVLDFNTTA